MGVTLRIKISLHSKNWNIQKFSYYLDHKCLHKEPASLPSSFAKFSTFIPKSQWIYLIR